MWKQPTYWACSHALTSKICSRRHFNFFFSENKSWYFIWIIWNVKTSFLRKQNINLLQSWLALYGLTLNLLDFRGLNLLKGFYFCHLFTRETTFVASCSLSYNPSPFLKWINSKRKEFAPMGGKSKFERISFLEKQHRRDCLPRKAVLRELPPLKMYPVHLTLVQLNPDMPCLCKQCRSRSVGFWRNQLICIYTICHWNVNLYQQPGSSNLIG